MSTVAELPRSLLLAQSLQTRRSTDLMHRSVGTFFAVFAGGLSPARVVSGLRTGR